MFFFSNKAGGFMHVITTANDNNMFVFIKNYDTTSIIHFLGALFTLMLGSIPQQDIFQRVTSAKNANVAQKGMLMGASLYLLFCLMPIFLVFSATIVDPSLVNKLIEEDSQMILPSFILTYTPMFVKVLFFGSLLAAIMSTASGTLLAPSVTIAENIIKKIFPNINDKEYIFVLRLTLLITGISVTLFALQSNSSIYEMVGDAYKITLVSAVVPLFAAMFWNRATTTGAYISIAFGLIVWIVGEIQGIIEPQFFGFLASLLGMIVGSYLSKPQENKLK
jgi:Na+/proline symporter